MSNITSIFKAYDIRGIYPSEIDEEAVYKIAQAYAKFLSPKTVALGRDVRTSGGKLWEAAKNGLIDHGVEVIDIGIVSTDMLYFAVANYKYDGGITISASHNPGQYNGMKFVRSGAVPISADSGLQDIQKLVEQDYQFKSQLPGDVVSKDVTNEYLNKCLSMIHPENLKHFNIVANAMYGPALQNVIKMDLPLTIKMLNENLDGTFPKGPPDPLLEEVRNETVQAIVDTKADFGVAWDGDADRFFLFDENGRFIPAYYLTAFFGQYFSHKNPGAKIICDTRLTWAIFDSVTEAGGIPMVNKAGHSFIKERMHKEDAVFAGECSGHYYFKDFYYCDNGLIPFLVFLEILSGLGKENFKVSELFDTYFDMYPISGEVNTTMASQEEALKALVRIENKYQGAEMNRIDGLSIDFHDWRANIRVSNTSSEPVIRLNVEGQTKHLVENTTLQILKLIRPQE